MGRQSADKLMAPRLGDISGFISALRNRLSAREGAMFAAPAHREVRTRESSVIDGQVLKNPEVREAMDTVKQTFTAASLRANGGRIVDDQRAVKTEANVFKDIGHFLLDLIVGTGLGLGVAFAIATILTLIAQFF